MSSGLVVLQYRPLGLPVYTVNYVCGGLLMNVIIIIITRSAGTVHTSAKARLTSVVIRIRIRIRILIRIRDPNRHENLIVCLLAHCQPSLKISCKSVGKFLHKVANKQTDKQTNNDD